jgi:hypothetical protein
VEIVSDARLRRRRRRPAVAEQQLPGAVDGSGDYRRDDSYNDISVTITTG